MEFLAGKFYRTRGGERVYCIGHAPHLPECYQWAFVFDSGKAVQTDRRGRVLHTAKTDKDIIAEWQEPVTVTAYWFGYVSKTSGNPESSAMYDSEHQAETRRKGFAAEDFRVGHVEKITTVVP